jgi:hypothetical protein
VPAVDVAHGLGERSATRFCSERLSVALLAFDAQELSLQRDEHCVVEALARFETAAHPCGIEHQNPKWPTIFVMAFIALMTVKPSTRTWCKPNWQKG